jgi:hypothetical protein
MSGPPIATDAKEIRGTTIEKSIVTARATRQGEEKARKI